MRCISLEAGGPDHRLGRGFGDAADVDLGARGARAFGHRIGHLLDMAIARIIENQHFCHVIVLSSSETGRSEEHTSELQSLMRISYAVFCLKKKNISKTKQPIQTNSTSITNK